VADTEMLEILRTIQADVATIKAVQEEHTNALEVLRQDAGLIRTGQNGHTRMLDMLQQDTRMIRGAVNDIARENVAPGEVEAIHHDLNRVQREPAELQARVDTIQGRRT
jgi:hypothetical protein